MRELSFGIIFYDSPIGRSYLNFLYQNNYKVKEIIALLLLDKTNSLVSWKIMKEFQSVSSVFKSILKLEDLLPTATKIYPFSFFFTINVLQSEANQFS